MAQLLESNGASAPQGLVEEERAFSAERVDATWAPGAEAGVLAKFAQTGGLALTSLQVECRSTMCRLQVASPISPGQDAAGPDAIYNSVGFKPRMLMAFVRFGTVQSVAYVPREDIAQDRPQ
jgi:hypothetical protein